MTISATSLYDYCNKNSQSYFKRASAILLRKSKGEVLSDSAIQLSKDLFKEANLLMNTVMEIEMGLKDDKQFLPAISFKNGVVKIGDCFEERTVWLKNFIDLSCYDLRYSEHKIQAIKDIANYLFQNRHFLSREATEEDIDLIFQLSCLHSDNLKPLLN